MIATYSSSEMAQEGSGSKVSSGTIPENQFAILWYWQPEQTSALKFALEKAQKLLLTDSSYLGRDDSHKSHIQNQITSDDIKQFKNISEGKFGQMYIWYMEYGGGINKKIFLIQAGDNVRNVIRHEVSILQNSEKNAYDKAIADIHFTEEVPEVVIPKAPLEAVAESEDTSTSIVEAVLSSIKERIDLVTEYATNAVTTAITTVREAVSAIHKKQVGDNEYQATFVGEKTIFKPRILIQSSGIKPTAERQSSDIVGDYRDFILLNANEIDAEKFQIVETFGSPKVYFFDRRARIFTYTIILRNDPINRWADKWKAMYDTHLRGTKCVENVAKIILQYEGNSRTGYILQSSFSLDANNDMMATASFTMFIESESNHTVELDIGNYKGLSQEDIGRLTADTNAAVEIINAARMDVKLIASKSKDGADDPSIGEIHHLERSPIFYIRAEAKNHEVAKALIDKYQVTFTIGDIANKNRKDLERMVNSLKLTTSNSTDIKNRQTGRLFNGRSEVMVSTHDVTVTPGVMQSLTKDENLTVPFSMQLKGLPSIQDNPPTIPGSFVLTGKPRSLEWITSSIESSGANWTRIDEGNIFKAEIKDVDNMLTPELIGDSTLPQNAKIARIRFQVLSDKTPLELEEDNKRYKITPIFTNQGNNNEFNSSSVSSSYVRLRKVSGSKTDMYLELILISKEPLLAESLSATNMVSGGTTIKIEGLQPLFNFSIKLPQKESSVSFLELYPKNVKTSSDGAYNRYKNTLEWDTILRIYGQNPEVLNNQMLLRLYTLNTSTDLSYNNQTEMDIAVRYDNKTMTSKCIFNMNKYESLEESYVDYTIKTVIQFNYRLLLGMIPHTEIPSRVSISNIQLKLLIPGEGERVPEANNFIPDRISRIL